MYVLGADIKINKEKNFNTKTKTDSHGKRR